MHLWILSQNLWHKRGVKNMTIQHTSRRVVAQTCIIIIIIIIINEKINVAFSPKTTRTRNIPKKTKKRRVR